MMTQQKRLLSEVNSRTLQHNIVVSNFEFIHFYIKLCGPAWCMERMSVTSTVNLSNEASATKDEVHDRTGWRRIVSAAATHNQVGAARRRRRRIQ